MARRLAMRSGNPAEPGTPAGRWGAGEFAFAVVGGAVIAAVLALGWRQLASPDIGFHLAAGRWIVENGRVPDVDTFTFGAAGRRYVDVPWLFQWVHYQAYRFWGAAGVGVAQIGAFGLAVAVGGWRWRKNGGKHGGLALLAVLLWAWANPWEPRPQVWSWGLLGLVLGLASSAAPGWRERLGLVVVFCLWSNVHAFFAVGLAALALVFGARMAEQRRWDRNGALLWLACAAATLFNPYGFAAWNLALEHAAALGGHVSYQSADFGIAELAPLFSERFRRAAAGEPDFGFLRGGVVAAGFVVCLVAAGWARLDWSQRALSVFFAGMACSANRNLPLCVAALAPLAVARMPERHAAAANRMAAGLAGVLAVLILAQARTGALHLGTANAAGGGWNQAAVPVRSCEFLNAQGIEGRLLTSFGDGGYVHFATRQPVYVDGRIEVIGPELFAQAGRSSLEPGAFQRLLERWQPAAVLVDHNQDVIRFESLLFDPDWKCVYWDDRDAVFIPRLARQELGDARSRGAPGLPPMSPGEQGAFLRRVRAHRTPGFVERCIRAQCHPQRELALSFFHLGAGNSGAAARSAMEGIMRGTVIPNGLVLNAAHGLFDSGSKALARDLYRVLPDAALDPAARSRLEGGR